MGKPNICVLHTGGTIGMEKIDGDYTIAPGHLAKQLTQILAFANPLLPDYEILEYAPMLDSANNTPQVWIKIAQSIATVYDQYDGFVILHGTDTMAYSASAVAFLLEGLNKPVIFTGSQIPLSEIRTDAVENLLTALNIAGNYPIAEVCLYFGGKLLRGCRTVKIDANRFDAFNSPNYPVLGWGGINIELNWGSIRHKRADADALTVRNLIDVEVGVFKIYPGFRPAFLRAFLSYPVQGLVLETYGVGAAPDQNPEFISVLQEAIARGVIVVNCTQCFHGHVNLTGYSTNSQLHKIGVLSAKDMTTEATLTKLFYLLGRNSSAEEIKRDISRDFCGELTNRAFVDTTRED